MVSALDSGLNGPGSSPSRGHCVVFLSKTLNSTGKIMLGGDTACDGLASYPGGSRNTPSRLMLRKPG